MFSGIFFKYVYDMFFNALNILICFRFFIICSDVFRNFKPAVDQRQKMVFFERKYATT